MQIRSSLCDESSLCAQIVSARLLVVQSGLDQTREQRMRLGRTGLEFRMGLGGHVERMHLARQFDEFGEFTISSGRR